MIISTIQHISVTSGNNQETPGIPLTFSNLFIIHELAYHYKWRNDGQQGSQTSKGKEN